MPVINANALPNGNLEGAEHGATISVILDHSEPGHGPRLHKHPYDETWVVVEGSLTFQSGEDQLKAGPGDIIIVPPDPDALGLANAVLGSISELDARLVSRLADR